MPIYNYIVQNLLVEAEKYPAESEKQTKKLAEKAEKGLQFFQKGYPNAFESEHILNEEEIIRLKNIIISSEFKIVNEQAVKIDTIDKYFIEITETDMDKTYNILIVGDKYLYCFGDKYGWIEVKNSDFIDYLKELVS